MSYTIRAIEGEDAINQVATAGMWAALDALVEAGAIEKSFADEFADRHVAIVLYDTPFLRRLRSFFGVKEKHELVRVVRATGEAGDK